MDRRLVNLEAKSRRREEWSCSVVEERRLGGGRRSLYIPRGTLLGQAGGSVAAGLPQVKDAGWLVASIQVRFCLSDGPLGQAEGQAEGGAEPRGGGERQPDGRTA